MSHESTQEQTINIDLFTACQDVAGMLQLLSFYFSSLFLCISILISVHQWCNEGHLGEGGGAVVSRRSR